MNPEEAMRFYWDLIEDSDNYSTRQTEAGIQMERHDEKIALILPLDPDCPKSFGPTVVARRCFFDFDNGLDELEDSVKSARLMKTRLCGLVGGQEDFRYKLSETMGKRRIQYVFAVNVEKRDDLSRLVESFTSYAK